LLSDIKGFGYRTIDDLIKIDKGDKFVFPIILKHLSIITDENDKEFLVRCLGVKGCFEATDLLIKEFKSSSNNTYKWAIGNSLSLIMDKNATFPFLLGLLEDKNVQGHALATLSNFKEPDLIPYIEPFVNHEITWIRVSGKRTSEKLEKLITNKAYIKDRH
jgi:hypothetical protein